MKRRYPLPRVISVENMEQWLDSLVNSLGLRTSSKPLCPYEPSQFQLVQADYEVKTYLESVTDKQLERVGLERGDIHCMQALDVNGETVALWALERGSIPYYTRNWIRIF